jgi:hypothetical protein
MMATWRLPRGHHHLQHRLPFLLRDGAGAEHHEAQFWIGASIRPNVPAGFQALFFQPMETLGTTVSQAGQSVYVSRNNGTNWTAVALPAEWIASAMEMPTPDQVLVGCTNGRIVRFVQLFPRFLRRP